MSFFLTIRNDWVDLARIVSKVSVRKDGTGVIVALLEIEEEMKCGAFFSANPTGLAAGFLAGAFGLLALVLALLFASADGEREPGTGVLAGGWGRVAVLGAVSHKKMPTMMTIATQNTMRPVRFSKIF